MITSISQANRDLSDTSIGQEEWIQARLDQICQLRYGVSFDNLGYSEEFAKDPHVDRESLRYKVFYEWLDRTRKD